MNYKSIVLMTICFLLLAAGATGQAFNQLIKSEEGWIMESTIDQDGDILITGQSYSGVSMTIDTTVLSTNLTNSYLFLLKLSTSGQLRWYKTMQSDSNFGSDEVFKIVTDNEKNIYLSTGFYSLSLTIDNDTTVGTYGGYQILKFDSSGNFIKHNYSNQKVSIATCGNGIYITQGRSIHKLDQDLDTIWTRQFTPFGVDELETGIISANKSGLISVAVHKDDNYPISIGIDTVFTNLSPYNNKELIVCVLDTNGSGRWINSFGSWGNNNLPSVSSLKIDSIGNVFFSTRCDSSYVFGNDTMHRQNINFSMDALIKYNADGTEAWAIPMNNKILPSIFKKYRLTLAQNHIIYSGNFSDSLYVDTLLISSPSTDYFIMKLDTSKNLLWFKKNTQRPFEIKQVESDLLGNYWVFGDHNSSDFNCFSTSYWGIFCSHLINDSSTNTSANFSFTTNTDTVFFINNSIDANAFSWNFGDGNSSTEISPSHTYTTPGNYIVTLIAYLGNCTDTMTLPVFITSIDENDSDQINIYPNPSSGLIHLTSNKPVKLIRIFDLLGNLILSHEPVNSGKLQLDLMGFANGSYLIKAIDFNNKVINRKQILMR